MKIQKENITEFLDFTGYNNIINNITDEHSDTYFYSDIDLVSLLEKLRQLNNKEVTFNILSFKDVFNVLQEHNFKIEKTKFLKKEFLNYINFVEDNLNFFRTILEELKKTENNFQKLIIFFDKINKENKETFKDIL